MVTKLELPKDYCLFQKHSCGVLPRTKGELEGATLLAYHILNIT